MKDFLKKIIKSLKLNYFLISGGPWVDLPLKNFVRFPIRVITFFADCWDDKKMQTEN